MSDELELSSREMIQIVLDRIRAFAPRHEPHRTSSYVGLERDGRVDNFIVLRPRKYGVRMDLRLPPEEPAIRALEGFGVTVYDHRPYGAGPGFHPVEVRPCDLMEHLAWFGLLLEKAYRTSSRYAE